MDYSLAALKLMCGQLKQAKETPSQSSFTLGGILFQRAWLQGVLVSISHDRSTFILDDGSGVIELSIAADFLTQDHWQIGNKFHLTFPLFFLLSPLLSLNITNFLSIWMSRDVCDGGRRVFHSWRWHSYDQGYTICPNFEITSCTPPVRSNSS